METRTAKMFTYAEGHGWDFTKAKQYVTVQGKEFRLLFRTIHHYTNEPLVSFGSHNARELLLLDPASSLLQTLYAELKAQIDKSKPIETILKQTMIFVRNQFPKKSDAEVIQVANSTGNRYKGNPVAYLDDFIKAKTGFCRHQALLLSYLLDSLMQDPDNLLPKGTIYTHRDDIIEPGNKSSVHTWVMLQFDHPKQLFHLDSQQYDEPHLLEGNLETNPHLCKYGAEAARQCWVRYSANPRTLSPQNEYKIADETFTVTDVNGSFTCELTAENKKFTYGIDQALGTGSFGAVYAMTSKDAFAPPIVVKSFTVQTYPPTATEKEIGDSLKVYFDRAKHEAEYNKMMGGIGVFYFVNSQAPIKTKIIMNPNGTSHQELVDPPHAYIAIKKEQGVQLKQYHINSATDYLRFCMAAVKSLQSIHAKQLVHSDVHNENLLVEELKTEPFIVVKYVDMTLCDYEGTLLSTQNLLLNIKPPEFKGQPSVIRNKKQDIHCLGRLFKEKYNDSYFSEPLKSRIEKLFNDMLEINPSYRPDTDKIFNELAELLRHAFILQCIIGGNANNLIQQLKNISDANERLTALTKLKNDSLGYIAKLSDLDVNALVSLWDNNQQQNEVLKLLFRARCKAIKLSPQQDSDNAINEFFYCKQVLFRLKNNGPIQESIASYQKLQSSTLEAGKGAVSYLEHVVKTADNFASCLRKLTPNQQHYLFAHVEPQTLRNLVNKTSVDGILGEVMRFAPTDSVATYLINKLGDDHVKNALKLKIDDELNQVKTCPHLLPEEIINNSLNCEDLSYQLTNNTITAQVVFSRYAKTLVVGLKKGEGAASYLQNVVKTANNLVPCLKQLAPSQQGYLFMEGEPNTLRNLVNETNFFDVVNATQHSDILFKKLGENYVKNILQLLIDPKLAKIKLFPQSDSDKDINEFFYCKQIPCQLKNGSIQEAIANYQKFQSSTLEAGKGAILYLSNVVNTADNFASCLKQLTPTQQCYLFTHGEPETLRNLVNETNLFDVINATPHLDLLFKKLDEDYIKNILRLMLKAKLTKIKSSPHADFDSAINERFYCEQILFQLKNKNVIEEAIVCYLTLQSSDLQVGKGAVRYLEHVVKTAKNFVPCLMQLTPNQQFYLFTHGQPKTLSNLVNENNFLSILKNTSHSNILLKNLDSQKRNQMIELMVRDRLANSTFKEAVKSFDTWNNNPALHKEILLAFNRVYYERRQADERSSYHVLNFFSKDDKLQASRALEGKMTPDDWKQHTGALHGDLGEVGQRLKKLAHVRLGSF